MFNQINVNRKRQVCFLHVFFLVYIKEETYFKKGMAADGQVPEESLVAHTASL